MNYVTFEDIVEKLAWFVMVFSLKIGQGGSFSGVGLQSEFSIV